MGFQNRLAAVEDVPAITEIYNQAIALKSVTADISPVSEDSRRSWLAEHSAEKYPVFVAEEQGAVMGRPAGVAKGASRIGENGVAPRAKFGRCINRSGCRHENDV